MAIYDTMQYVRPERRDVLHGPGRLDGPRSLLAGPAAKGKRYSLPQRAHPHPSARWVASRVRRRTIDIHAKEILRNARQSSTSCSSSTRGRPSTRIKSDTERDYFMSAMESKEYGLIDEVLVQKIPGK